MDIEDDTSCGLAGDGNGRIEVREITIGATTYSTYGEFTFSWYSGNNPISSNLLSGETGNEITDRFANSYTLRISKSGPPFSPGETGDTGVGCENTFLYNINSNPDNIRVARVTSTDVVSCNPPTGSIAVEDIGIESVNEPFSSLSADYSVRVYSSGNIQQGSPLTPSSRVADGLEADTYTLRLTHAPTQCISEDFVWEVQDNRVLPDIDEVATVVTDDVSCSAPFAGAVRLVVIPSTGLRYDWYNLLDPTISISSSASLSAVEAGRYRVVVTSTTTSCADEAVFTIGTSQERPRISRNAENITHNTRCDVGNENGAIRLSATNILPADTYDWVLGQGGVELTTSTGDRGDL